MKSVPFDTKILPEKIEAIKTSFENGQFGDALFIALNTGSGLMQQRIFAQNTDVEGNGFGGYVGVKRKVRLQTSANKTTNKRLKAIAGQSLTAHQRKRARAGRQILKKDLELHGNLRRAIETVIESETAAVLEFNNSNAALIAKGQEQQIGRIMGTGKIFKLSQTEKEQVTEQGLLLIKQVLQAK